jgi:hypothetical protein
MATGQAASSKQKVHWGRILVALGLTGLVADLAFLALPLEHLVERLKDGLFGVLPSLGLSFLNAIRAVALHQVDYFSLVSRILVLFSAMVAMIIGLVLLRSHYAGTTGANDLNSSALREGETNNG